MIKYSENSNKYVPFTHVKILPQTSVHPLAVPSTVRDFIHELGFLTPVTLTPLWDNRSPLVTVLRNTYQYLLSAYMLSIFPAGPISPKRGTSVLGSPGGSDCVLTLSLMGIFNFKE
jgi:hypothetical protein